MPNTTEIKVLGTGTSRHKMVVSVLREYLDRAGIPIPVKEYTDIDQFINADIESVPAVIFNNKIYSLGSNDNFNASLRKTVSAVLRDSNYGAIDKVVIPVDFSDVSTNAFAYGHRMATNLGAITKAVHIYYPSPQDLVESTAVNVDFAMLRQSYLDDFVNTFDIDWGSDLMRVSLIDGEFRTGFPADGILDSIKENNAFIAVVGTTGKSGLVKKWFGSVCTKIMNKATSPVLVVPPEARYRGIKKIAFAYDDITQDKDILKQLTSFARRFDTELHLIHVEGNNSSKPDPGYYLAELLSRQYPMEKIINTTIVSDDVPKSISDYCFTHDIDVISLSTHRKGFLEQLYDDNISQQMTSLSSLPLLILKP